MERRMASSSLFPHLGGVESPFQTRSEDGTAEPASGKMLARVSLPGEVTPPRNAMLNFVHGAS